MTRVATGRLALTLSGLIGLLAVITAFALIAVVLGDPRQVVVATTDGDFSGVSRLILDRLTSAALALWRLLF